MLRARHVLTVIAFLAMVGTAVLANRASADNSDYALYKAQRGSLEKQLAPAKAKCIATQDPDACQNVSLIQGELQDLDQQNQNVIAAHEMEQLQQQASKEQQQQLNVATKRALAGDPDAQEYILTQAVAGDDDARRTTIALAGRYSTPSIDSAIQQLAQQGYAPAQQLLKDRADSQLQQALNGGKQAEAAIVQRAEEDDPTVIPVLIKLAKRNDATAQIAVLHWAETSALNGAFGQPVIPDLGTAQVIQQLPRDSAAWTVIRRYPDQAQALLAKLKNLPSVSTSAVAPSRSQKASVVASATTVSRSVVGQQPASGPSQSIMASSHSGRSTAVAVESAAHPSFNCALARSVVEGMICGSTELSALDAKLAGLYKSKLKATGNRSVLRSQQLQWMRQRNACGANASCLEQTYERRISQLQ